MNADPVLCLVGGDDGIGMSALSCVREARGVLEQHRRERIEREFLEDAEPVNDEL